MERPISPSADEWIRYKRYATHNLPQHMKDYLDYQSKMSSGILTRAYFTKMAKMEKK
jgi:hypothetical protein